MNELQSNLETMEKLYQEKIKQVGNNGEFQYISGKLAFIQDLKLVLWANENMERFTQNMGLKEDAR